eukprot:2522079-Karenia_brevis.AAC.1
MIGNSKFWHILKKPPWIFSRSRMVQGIKTWGADILHVSVFEHQKGVSSREREDRVDKMFLPIFAKQVTDEARKMWKVPRGLTPGSGKWMNTTDKLVGEFQLYWGEYYPSHEKSRAFKCDQCG